MTFPLIPMVTKTQDTAVKVTPAVLDDSERVLFDVFFKVELPVEEGATPLVVEGDVPIEDVVELPDGGEVLDKDFPEVSAAKPNETPHRHQQTLIESTFAPVISQTRTDVPTAPMHLLAKSENDQTKLVSKPQEQGQATEQNLGANRAAPSGRESLTNGPTTHALQLPVAEDTLLASKATPQNIQTMTNGSQALPINSQAMPRISQATKDTNAAEKREIPITTSAQNQPTGLSMLQVGKQATATIQPAQAKHPRLDSSERTSQLAPQPQTSAPAGTIQSPLIAVQTANQTTLGDEGSRNALAEKVTAFPLEVGASDIQTSHTRAAGSETTHTPTQTQHMAKAVANQMAVAVSQNAAGTTEILLSPEELGRVRMVMTTQDGGISVVVHAERQETSELLRRHIETLSQEFKAMGYGSSSFTFAQDQQRSSAQDADAPASTSAAQDDTQTSLGPVKQAASAGLDLRL